jgi:hypothetical protein
VKQAIAEVSIFGQMTEEKALPELKARLGSNLHSDKTLRGSTWRQVADLVLLADYLGRHASKCVL